MWKRIVIHNNNNMALLRPSIQMRFLSNTANEKIQKISQDKLEIIDQPHSENYKQKKFHVMRRQKHREEMQKEPEKYHPVIHKLFNARAGADIITILSDIDKKEFKQEEHFEHDEEEDTKYLQPTIHQIYAEAIKYCADLNQLDLCWEIFETCKRDKILSNELYDTMMWVCMYDNRSKQALE